MEYLALITVGVATGLISYAILDTFFSEERRVQRRLASLQSYTADALADAEPLAAPFRDRVLKPSAGAALRLLGAITPGDYRARLSQRVVTAGGSARVDPDRIMLFKLVLGTATAVVAFMSVRGMHVGFPRASLTALIAGIVFSFLPDLLLSAKAQRRQHMVIRELPDMLDMLTISVEAGLGFDQAVSRYVRHSKGPLGKEFGIALMEIQAGKSRRDALKQMAERVDVQELRTFVMSIVQADAFGVSVSDVLRTQSREMRIKRRQRAEELAQKAPAKMAFPLVICILPATLIVVMAPAIVGLMRLFAGQ